MKAYFTGPDPGAGINHYGYTGFAGQMGTLWTDWVFVGALVHVGGVVG